MNWILGRLKERSTWVGIITLVTSLGVALEPEQVELIITIGSSIVGLILTFTADA